MRGILGLPALLRRSPFFPRFASETDRNACAEALELRFNKPFTFLGSSDTLLSCLVGPVAAGAKVPEVCSRVLSVFVFARAQDGTGKGNGPFGSCLLDLDCLRTTALRLNRSPVTYQPSRGSL